MELETKRLLVWGAGELGGRVAARWPGQVLGYTQSTTRHNSLRAAGVGPHVGSPVDELTADDLLLLSLPGHATQHKALNQLQAADAPRPRRAVMVSSTGFYGLPRPDVTTIDETTPPADKSRAQAIAQAETAFHAWAGTEGVVIRAGGLYGPGRGPFSAVRRRGYPRLGPPNRTLALIHYDDLASIILAALTHPNPAPAYIAVTPPCPTRQQFYEAVCARLGLPQPIFTAPATTPPTSYDVSLLRRDLLPTPAYPHWRSALEQ